MKRRILPTLLTLILCLAAVPASAAGTQPDPDQVYRAMIALKEQYPEGLHWTNDNYYRWQGGIYSGGGGCVAFAFTLSDAAFGDAPARMLQDFDYSDVRVGDILRINQDTHSVIVLEVHPDHLVIAEGNFNSSVHWGRTLSQRDVTAADYLITRYPEAGPAASEETGSDGESSAAEEIPASGTAYASAQTVTVDGKPVEFQMYALKNENGDATNYIKLRDLAYVLNGTAAQFSVGWDGNTSTISVTAGEAYQASGSETAALFTGDQPYTGGRQSVTVSGAGVEELTAITLTDSQGGGYTYFKLRDLGSVLGFTVGWSAEAGVFVETSGS